MGQCHRLLLIIKSALHHSTAINHAAELTRASGASVPIAAILGDLNWAMPINTSRQH